MVVDEGSPFSHNLKVLKPFNTMVNTRKATKISKTKKGGKRSAGSMKMKMKLNRNCTTFRHYAYSIGRNPDFDYDSEEEPIVEIDVSLENIVDLTKLSISPKETIVIDDDDEEEDEEMVKTHSKEECTDEEMVKLLKETGFGDIEEEHDTEEFTNWMEENANMIDTKDSDTFVKCLIYEDVSETEIVSWLDDYLK